MQDHPPPPIADAPLSLILIPPDYGPVPAAAVRDWEDQLAARGKEFELLLVSRAPADPGEPSAAPASPNGVRRLVQATAGGPGAALRCGLAAASHPLVGYVPADGRYRPPDLAALLAQIDKGDLVAARRIWPPDRRRPLGEGLFRLVVRVLFGVRLADVDSWFLLVRRSALRRVRVQSDGAFAHAEILAKTNFIGCRMGEAPVSYQPGPDGETRPDRRRDLWPELRRVLKDPDFGPPVLPEGPVPDDGLPLTAPPASPQ